MAKKRKNTRSAKKQASLAPEHTLPGGFWRQVGAVLLIVFSLLIVVAWFKAGGPILNALNAAGLMLIGYTVYVLPALLIYIGVEILRSENNRLAWQVNTGAILLLILLSGLFGLFKNSAGDPTGGYMGSLANAGMLMLVNSTIGAFIYVLLILITLLFIFRTLPNTIFDSIRTMIRRDSEELENNVRVMRKAARSEVAEEIETELDDDFTLNEGVPVTKDEPEVKPKKQSRLKNIRGSLEQDKVAEEQPALVMASDPNWVGPEIELLEKKQSPANAGDIEGNAAIIKETLADFGIGVKMDGANVGPKVTQYMLSPMSGVRMNKIASMGDNIAFALAAQAIRIEAPIPGKRAVGVEVPNVKAADVRLRGVLSSKEWKKSTQPLTFGIGKDIAGKEIVGELNKMPHLLVAGQTGSGKSVMINSLLISLLYRNSPSDMKLILVDPKQVEMAPYKDIPHLLAPIITEPEKAASALKWAVNEMERRLKMMAEANCREIKSYNERIKKNKERIQVQDEDGNMQEVNDATMPYIVVVIDEMADLMMMKGASKEIEALIMRLAQKARAAGIHLVLATQRPSVNVITGPIKANIPARLAFTVASLVDSRTILDCGGAEKLLGYGDMLMSTAQLSKPLRVQGALVTDEEVMAVTAHLCAQGPPQYNDEIVNQKLDFGGKGGVVMGNPGDNADMEEAAQVILANGKASTSFLQSKLRWGYGRANRVVNDMVEAGLLGDQIPGKGRQVLFTSMDEVTGAGEMDE